MKEPKPLPCPGCNGTGQTTYFGGVSRFLLSYEDCLECNGVGFLKAEPDDNLLSEHISSQSSLSRPQAEKFRLEPTNPKEGPGEPAHLLVTNVISVS